ncbi:hypothetical protein BD413DRAFT_528223 [Trametes elegans]|nr:hypothetical protein BD413DRAFT_528223 [Trametes elegans]
MLLGGGCESSDRVRIQRQCPQPAPAPTDLQQSPHSGGRAPFPPALFASIRPFPLRPATSPQQYYVAHKVKHSFAPRCAHSTATQPTEFARPPSRRIGRKPFR